MTLILSERFVMFTQGEMMMQDKLEKERCDAKNAVEEYVYEMRDKIANVLAQFIKEEVRSYHNSNKTKYRNKKNQRIKYQNFNEIIL